ncbi:hypothetical protein C8R44DRAFT_405269 [Mycena epipterygia]|nr:hypothetical protein C8R44DRAFT_405269 [Mycena epipterygia]
MVRQGNASPLLYKHSSHSRFALLWLAFPTPHDLTTLTTFTNSNMLPKYFALLSVCLAVNAIAIPQNNKDALGQVQDSDAFKKLVDGIDAGDDKFHDAVNSTKHEFEEHKHKHVKTLEIVESKGGPTMTVVTAPGGPAVTLAAPGQGKATTFDGHIYTVIPATFIHPSSPHLSSSLHGASSHESSSSHLTSLSATPSAHIIKTTVTSGQAKATVVSISGESAITLASQGTTTIIGGSTYTVQPTVTQSSASHSSSASSESHSVSGSSSSAGVVANVASSASASASGSHIPNAAVAYTAGSLYATMVGLTVTTVGVLLGSLLIL